MRVTIQAEKKLRRERIVPFTQPLAGTFETDRTGIHELRRQLPNQIHLFPAWLAVGIIICPAYVISRHTTNCPRGALPDLGRDLLLPQTEVLGLLLSKSVASDPQWRPPSHLRLLEGCLALHNFCCDYITLLSTLQAGQEELSVRRTVFFTYSWPSRRWCLYFY